MWPAASFGVRQALVLLAPEAGRATGVRLAPCKTPRLYMASRHCGIARIQSHLGAWHDSHLHQNAERPNHAAIAHPPPPWSSALHGTPDRLHRPRSAGNPGQRHRQALSIEPAGRGEEKRCHQDHIPAQQLRRNHCRARPPHVPRMQRHAQRGRLPGIYAEIATAHPCIAAIRPKGHGAAQPRPLVWLACKQRHHSARPSPAASRACDRRIRASPPLS